MQKVKKIGFIIALLLGVLVLIADAVLAQPTKPISPVVGNGLLPYQVDCDTLNVNVLHVKDVTVIDTHRVVINDTVVVHHQVDVYDTVRNIVTIPDTAISDLRKLEAIIMYFDHYNDSLINMEVMLYDSSRGIGSMWDTRMTWGIQNVQVADTILELGLFCDVLRSTPLQVTHGMSWTELHRYLRTHAYVNKRVIEIPETPPMDWRRMLK